MKTFSFLADELWYGGVVFHADKYPISKDDEYETDAGVNDTCNQCNPVFLSNKGRYFWLGNGGRVKFQKGVIQIENEDAEIEIGGETLKAAAKSAAENIIPRRVRRPISVRF